MEENKNEMNSGQEITENEVVDDNSIADTSVPTETEKLSTELAEQKEKYLRLFADFDNFKKRTAKERLEQNLTAGKEIIVSLLEVLDDCERAEKQIKSSNGSNQHSEGTLLVFNKLRTILQQKGLTAMESINTTFDVEKHEAITEIAAGPESVGKVIDELEKGYYLNDRIIRFAKVVVGK